VLHELRTEIDGQHPVSELRTLLEAVWAGKCDLAVGSRFATPGGNGFSRERYESSTARRLGMAGTLITAEVFRRRRR
jgi:hypothetical protein